MHAWGRRRSPLEIGVAATLVSMAIASLLGAIAVLDAETASTSLATGFAIALLVFLAGGTIACALACLRRGRATAGALLALLSACLALDLLVLAIWLEIDSEVYGKFAGLAFVWTLFGLTALALTLAVSPAARLAHVIYRAAIVAIVLAGALASWLVLTSGGAMGFGDVSDLGLIPGGPDDDGELQALGVLIVVVATLWFAALAADRLAADRRAPGAAEPDA
jgi:hypothetical protein